MTKHAPKWLETWTNIEWVPAFTRMCYLFWNMGTQIQRRPIARHSFPSFGGSCMIYKYVQNIGIGRLISYTIVHTLEKCSFSRLRCRRLHLPLWWVSDTRDSIRFCNQTVQRSQDGGWDDRNSRDIEWQRRGATFCCSAVLERRTETGDQSGAETGDRSTGEGRDPGRDWGEGVGQSIGQTEHAFSLRPHHHWLWQCSDFDFRG